MLSLSNYQSTMFSCSEMQGLRERERLLHRLAMAHSTDRSIKVKAYEYSGEFFVYEGFDVFLSYVGLLPSVMGSNRYTRYFEPFPRGVIGQEVCVTALIEVKPQTNGRASLRIGLKEAVYGLDRESADVPLEGAQGWNAYRGQRYFTVLVLSSASDALLRGNFPLVLQRNLVSEIIRGTSINGPMTVARAAPDPRPKRVVATAIATSK